MLEVNAVNNIRITSATKTENDNTTDEGKVNRKLLFQGRKYLWQDKLNIHLHVIKYIELDIIEIIAFNSDNPIEAPRLYLSRSKFFSLLKGYGKALSFVKQNLAKQMKPILSEEVLADDVKDSYIIFNILHYISSHVNPFEIIIDMENIQYEQAPPLPPSNVRRLGKSPKLIGKVDDISLFDQSYINMFESQAFKSIFQILPTKKKREKKIAAQNDKKYFELLGNDLDLLLESLSFIHISEYLIFQCVCKRWRDVLSYGLKMISSLVITSRIDINQVIDYKHDCVDLKLKPKPVPKQLSFDNKSDLNEMTPVRSSTTSEKESFLNLPAASEKSDDAVEEFFVSAETVNKIFSKVLGIFSLRLDSVVFNGDVLDTLSRSIGTMKVLSLGLIKFDQVSIEDLLSKKVSVQKNAIQTNQNKSKQKSPPRSLISPSAPTNIRSKQSRLTPKAKFFTLNEEDREDEKETKRIVYACDLPLLNGSGLEHILKTCGNGLLSLELDIRIGSLPENIFRHVPNLLIFKIINTALTNDSIQLHKRHLEGTVTKEKFINTFIKGMDIIDLLQLMSYANKEALMLVDRMGNFVVGNRGWELLFGYKSDDMYGLNWSFLTGSMTDINVIVSIEDSIKRTRECVEDYGFFHNVISKCLLVQVIVIPFISTHRGLPLQSNCLQPHELEKLAEILPELNTELSEMLGNYNAIGSESTTTYEELMALQVDREYHLFRFGYLSQPFDATTHN